MLPAVNATINGTAFLCLVGSYRAIRNKNILLHQRLNTAALALSALFLVSYVSYHMTTESTPFCKEGWIRAVYFFVLITHILMSIAIVPMVLTTYLLGLGEPNPKAPQVGAHHLPHLDLRDLHRGGGVLHDFTLLPLVMRTLLPCAIALLLVVLAMDAEAQCVMCKAVAEDSAEDGSLGRGLNSGILYLMGIPYAIMAFFAWFVFRKRKEATDVAG